MAPALLDSRGRVLAVMVSVLIAMPAATASDPTDTASFTATHDEARAFAQGGSLLMVGDLATGAIRFEVLDGTDALPPELGTLPPLPCVPPMPVGICPGNTLRSRVDACVTSDPVALACEGVLGPHPGSPNGRLYILVMGGVAMQDASYDTMEVHTDGWYNGFFCDVTAGTAVAAQGLLHADCRFRRAPGLSFGTPFVVVGHQEAGIAGAVLHGFAA